MPQKTKTIKYKGYIYIRPVNRSVCLGKRKMEHLEDWIDKKLRGYYGDAEAKIEIKILK